MTRDEARTLAEQRILNGARAYNLARCMGSKYRSAKIWFAVLQSVRPTT